MKRPVRHEDGMYHINGNKYKMLMGSRIQVHNRNAYKTEGGLTRDKLMMNKWGRIVSLAKHRTAKKEKRLEKAGYFAKKGKFGYVKKTARKSGKATRGSRKMRGGDEPAQAPAPTPTPTPAPAPAPAPNPGAGGSLALVQPSNATIVTNPSLPPTPGAPRGPDKKG
jgi:hypothetical protein